MTMVADLAKGGRSHRWNTKIVWWVWQELDKLGAELYMASWIRGMLFNKQADQLSRWINKDDRTLYVARWCREFRMSLAPGRWIGSRISGMQRCWSSTLVVGIGVLSLPGGP